MRQFQDWAQGGPDYRRLHGRIGDRQARMYKADAQPEQIEKNAKTYSSRQAKSSIHRRKTRGPPTASGSLIELADI